MPRASKAAKPSLPSQTLIVDNGAYNIKAGFAPPDHQTEAQCRITPNCIARGRDRRVWIGSQLDQCKDFGEMAFRRPVEKGYIVNWEGEKAIWDHEFLAKVHHLQALERNSLLTRPVRPARHHITPGRGPQLAASLADQLRPDGL